MEQNKKKNTHKQSQKETQIDTEQISTTYIHKKLSYFFCVNEAIDIEIGGACETSINYCLDVLEQVISIKNNSNSQQVRDSLKIKILQACYSLQWHLVEVSGAEQQIKKNGQKMNLDGSQNLVKIQFEIKQKQYKNFYHNDGLSCTIFALKNYLEYMSTCNIPSTNKVSIIDEAIIKSLINLIYVSLYAYLSIYVINYSDNSKENTDSKKSSHANSIKLKNSLQELEIDNLLIKMITLTLESYYLPIKKLVMLYTRVLSILFVYQNYQDHYKQKQNEKEKQKQKQNEKDKKIIQHGRDIINLYTDSQMLDLCTNNLLNQNYLLQFKQKNKPEDIKTKAKNNPVEHFYAKHNVGDCPLAQSIVVGLLRSLLTICNSQVHKKFQVCPPKGSGADSYRQWQISYQYLSQYETLLIKSNIKDGKDYKAFLSERSKKLLKDYIDYNQSSGQVPGQKNSTITFAPQLSGTHFEFYRHKIYTTSAISTFFSYLLTKFKKNATIQFTYLYQLISDANGVLVFLKFLTDKFEHLQPSDQFYEVDLRASKNIERKIFSIRFKDEVMLTVYSVLLVLYGACNNYTQKTKSYLFEYNSYLIIKKIPHIFMKVHKNDDQLPSEQQIQAQFGLNKRNNSKSNKNQELDKIQLILTSKVKQLTELCYMLLKIQIPFFSKKMKQNTNNMKMIVEIYCQMPKKIQPIKWSQLDKLFLKNKLRKNQQHKFILSVEELKGLHNEYNNTYYWSNQQAKINEANDKKQEIKQQPLQMTKEEMEKWLQDNLWRFYD